MKILDFVFPEECVICSDPKELLCRDCIDNLEAAHLKCLRCGRLNPSGRYCPVCLKRFLPEMAISVFKYDGAAKELVHKMKYQDQHTISVPLGRLIASRLKKVGDFSSYRVTFVPVDKKRGRYRGYNQAKLLAHVVAEKLKIECQETLVRVRETESQIYADSYHERRKNVKQSIRAIDIVQGNFLLIDDVITSGATVEEAAKVLFRAGAQKVIAASVCLG